mmetsp:Transcript_2238/g.5959  ORF Transcript_2238/g.5959 Transcript_2238/m.5959 type:complete len:176 (+) Transcript_2238:84-611(+)
MFTLQKQVKTKKEAKTTTDTSPAELRVQNDISKLDIPTSMKLSFPEKSNIMNFELVIQPEEGYWARGRFKFTVNILPSYPHDPPKVHCDTKIYHPNIDLKGNVCLNILRREWKPVLTLNHVLYGLQLLFLDPNPKDPLNEQAAELMKNNPHAFRSNVNNSMRGGYVSGEHFPPVL